MFSAEEFLGILNNYSNIAILISLFVSLLIAISGVIPSVFVTGANILFFGPIKGITISVLGETIGAYVTYYLYRKGFKKGFDKLSNKYNLIKRIVDSKGIEGGLLIFQGRLIPFIPSGFITLAGAVSEINVWIFIVATFLGKIPSILLEGLVSYGILSSGATGIKIAVGGVATYFLIKYLFFNKTKEQ
ncbi:MAG: TVP38/TMEM64 family protein [Clostridium sp.]